MKRIFLIIMISTFVFMFSNVEAQSDTTIYTLDNSTDDGSRFIGDYKKFLLKNLRYPPEAYSKGQQGDVYLRFVIEKDSTISHLEAEGIYPSLNTEALRIFALTNKKWMPGIKDGVPVRTWKKVKITFQYR